MTKRCNSKHGKYKLLSLALILGLSAPLIAIGFYALQGDVLKVVDGTKYLKDSEAQTVYIEEEEEEEIVDPFSIDPKKGWVLPNQPLNIDPVLRSQLRDTAQKFVKSYNPPFTHMERDVFNSIFFNYGLQILDDNSVIILESYIPGMVQTQPMLSPNVSIPTGALQILRESSEGDKGSIVDDLNNNLNQDK